MLPPANGEFKRTGAMCAVACCFGLAWYQDALNHDPGNPVLVRAVDLADWMVKHREGSSALSSFISTISGQRTLLGLNSSDPHRRAQAIVDAFGQEADEIARRNSDERLSDWDRAFRDRALDEILKQKVEAAEFADAIEKAKKAER